MSNPITPETSHSAIPSAAQLAETRLKQWHQQGEALLTMENLRGWLNAAGLVLFAPRPQISAPAPSLIEAVLGVPCAAPTLEQTAEPRSLLARLVAEGLAVPLNLLGASAGTPGDTPDFIASTAVFSYVFTLRGDKAWKQPPSASGATKVSNLALAIHQALTERGPLSAYDLTTEVGKEVTEAAVLRALGELWMHLRVLPLQQPDGANTLWELTGARLTKQIKAGANAGQPSALSALISLYLGQAMVASEDEIESFLSPLASRSRIRDVIHALLAARELDTLAVEGRTMLHIAGAMPAFVTPAPAPAAIAEGAVTDAVPAPAEADSAEQPRITKYIAKPRKIGTGYLAKAKPTKFGARPGPFERGSKPSSRPAFKDRASSSLKPRERSAAGSDRERRPFRKAVAPGFDKPWNEDKARKPRVEGDKPAPRREFASGGDRPPRKTFSKPGTFGRKREGFAARPSSEGRPPRREFTPRPGQDRDQGPRPRFDRSSTARPSRSSEFRPSRPQADRPQRGREEGAESRGREAGSFGTRKPYAPRTKEGSGFAGKKSFFKPEGRNGSRDGERPAAGADRPKRVYRKFDAPRDRPARPFSPDLPARDRSASVESHKPAGDFSKRKFGGKPSGKPTGKSGGFGEKRDRKSSGGPGARRAAPKPGTSFSGKSASPFAKFVGNKKPFGNRPPARKYKPREGDSA